MLEQALEFWRGYGGPVLGAIVLLIAGYVASRWMAHIVRSRAERSKVIDSTLVPILASVTRGGILIVTGIAVLNRFGVETTSLVAMLGAAGLAIGLALQGTLSNVAAGVMLLTFRPFHRGDLVEVHGTMATVDELNLFMTKMRTPENIFLMMPNSQIWGAEIRNYTRNDTRRTDLIFGIGYQDDMDRAIDLVREVLDADPRVLKDPVPLVGVRALADSSVNILARYWTHRTDFFQTQLDLTKRVKERFDASGISIPFPQRDVHLYQTQ